MYCQVQRKLKSRNQVKKPMFLIKEYGSLCIGYTILGNPKIKELGWTCKYPRYINTRKGYTPMIPRPKTLKYSKRYAKFITLKRWSSLKIRFGFSLPNVWMEINLQFCHGNIQCPWEPFIQWTANGSKQ